MLVLDIDFFKRINDSFGHDVGDKVLIEFSKIIQSVLEKFNGCTFFRLGGEEFCIIYQTSQSSLVYQLSETIHDALLNHDWKAGIAYIDCTMQHRSWTAYSQYTCRAGRNQHQRHDSESGRACQ